MTRVATTNYQADTDTKFQWAESKDDFFSRTLDLNYLAKALERHTHDSGRGLPVRGYATASIPTSAIVANPIFAGTVGVTAGMNITGTLAVTGNITATGNINGATVSGTGAISNAGGGAAIIGNSSITGTLNVSAALTAASLHTTGTATIDTSASIGTSLTVGTTIAASGNITSSGAIGATTGLSTTGGGAVIVGNSSVTGTLSVTSTLSAAVLNITGAGGISALAGGINVSGGLTLQTGNLSVAAGAIGHRDTITPSSDLSADLGGPGVRYGTLYALHATISGTSSYAGRATYTAGIDVNDAYGILLATGGITMAGNLSVSGTSGFHQIQPAADNTYRCGTDVGPLRWTAIYAVNGTIQTSSREVKAHLDELDPAEALRVVRDTKLYEFEYLAADEKPKARKAARKHRQVGYIAEDAHPLLLVDDAGVNAQTTASIALAAIQALSAQVEELQEQVRMLRA